MATEWQSQDLKPGLPALRAWACAQPLRCDLVPPIPACSLVILASGGTGAPAVCVSVVPWCVLMGCCLSLLCAAPMVGAGGGCPKPAPGPAYQGPCLLPPAPCL